MGCWIFVTWKQLWNAFNAFDWFNFFLNFYTIVRNFCTWNLRGLKQRTRSGTTNIDAFFYLFLLDFHWFIDICVWHWWEFLELLTLIKYLWIAVPSNLKTNFPKICKLTSAMKWIFKFYCLVQLWCSVLKKLEL